MEREKAIEILNALAWVQGGPDREEIITAISMAIEALSVEAVQGEWIRCEREIKDLEGNILCHVYWYECDQCRSKPPRKQFEKQEWLSDFCPNCGARMKGGDD